MANKNDVQYYRALIAKLNQAENECWEWQGAKNKDGYGQTSYHGKQVSTHQLMIMLLGKHDAKLVIDHICKNRACCNPDHLRMVTNRENILNKDSNNVAAKNMRKTHCKWGHKLAGDNLRIDTNKNGKKSRRCKECKRLAAAKRRESIGVKKIILQPSLSQIQLFS